MFKYINTHLNKNDQLLKHSLVILIGSSLANILNYFYQLAMGRLLGPAEYGILGALFSVMYVATFSLGTIKTVVMKFTSEYAEEPGKIKSLMKYSFEKLALYGSIGFILFLLASVSLAKFLNIDNPVLIVLTGIFLFLSVLTPIPMGVLNGLEKYMPMNVVGVVVALVKLLLGVAAVSLSYGVFGALVALDLSQVLAIVVPLVVLLPFLRVDKEKIEHVDLLKYSLPVFVGITMMNLFVNIDVLLVKHYFTSVEAGYYAAASIIGKTILFGTSALVIVMFPKVSKESNNSSPLLKSTLFYTFVMAATASALFFIVPTFISNSLFGKAYEISSYVGLFGLALGIFSLSNVLMNYHLALNNTSFVYWLIPFLLLEVGAITIFHSSLKEVIQVVLVTNVLLAGFLLFMTQKELGINATL